ncbi:magnesium-translocating P-type ATPase, partial [Escherichia coli]|nr:magnesium-translocating P-type ATPase [Escherichia coli]
DRRPDALTAAIAYRKIDELPFDFVRRRLSIVVENNDDGGQMLICKGAVEEMLTISTAVRDGQATRPLDDAERQRLQQMARGYNADGFRV